MRRLFIVANIQRKPEAAGVLRELLPWLRKRVQVVGVDRDGQQALDRIKADLVMVVGGDGTMLSVARRLKGNPIPVLGVNLGHLGFLAEVPHVEIRKILPRVLNGQFVLSPRMMLRVRMRTSSGRALPGDFVALNDAVLLRRSKGAMMSVRVSVSGEEIARYKGDGLIVSTATGSTGYSLSAGGPILSERLKAFIIAPICAHTLANRPIVISGEETLEIIPETRTGASVELALDSQVFRSLPSGSRLCVEKALCEFNLMTVGRKGRYEIIRNKLHWAGWVKEGR